MLFLNQSMRTPWFERPQMKKNKESKSERELRMGFIDNLRERLTSGVFQGTAVNVDYSDLNGTLKRVMGATLTRIGNDYIELSSTSPFPVFTFITGMPAFSSPELVRTIIIPIPDILDVRKL